MTDHEKNIPEQVEGQQTDSTHSISLNTQEDAAEHFNIVKHRLLDVSRWHSLTGGVTAEFQLTDGTGNPVSRLAQIGDHFQIDIPAPGTITGDGKDWVRIENIDDKSNPAGPSEYLAITVRPATNPTNTDPETAHFFKDEATSTFIAKREGIKITAEVHGRNEIPNTEEQGLIDTIRNAAVAVGAMLGFSKVQWKSLVKGLVE